MKHNYDEARRHAEATLAEVNRHMADGKVTRNPRNHQMLTDMMEKATRTLENLDRMDARMDTDDRYTSDARRYRADHRDVNDLTRTAMDMVDMLLPQLADDDMDDIDDRRGRPRTTRRGVGRYTQVRRHVRRMPGRADLDDRYADDLGDHNRYDRMDDDDYDVDDRRGRRMPRRGLSGRFIRGDDDRYMDNRYDDDKRTSDRRMDDDRRTRMDDDRRDERTDDRRPGPR